MSDISFKKENKYGEEEMLRVQRLETPDFKREDDPYSFKPILINVGGTSKKDSVKDDRLDIVSLLKRALEFVEKEQYQQVANICYNIQTSLKRMKEAQ